VLNQKIKNRKFLFRLLIAVLLFVVFFGPLYIFETKTARAASDEDNERWSKLSVKDREYCEKADAATMKDKDEIEKFIGICYDIHIAYSGGPMPAVGVIHTESDNGACSIGQWASSNWFKCSLLMILSFEGVLLAFAASLFSWIVDAQNIKHILGSSDGTLYELWKIVRDFLNISFILVLLLSAFSTIFRVEKYNYKKILITLILMALLVNFSFSITRAIIDFFNLLMYTIIGNFLQGDYSNGNFLGTISDASGLQAVLNPKIDVSTTYLFSLIVFVFIFAITLLAVAVLLLIRMIALAILIIFSPLGFIGKILPDTNNYADKWWSSLFQYAFFGPIMMFMLYITIQITSALGGSKIDIAAVANQNYTSPSVIANLVYFSIPIVLLWMGMGVANSMSIAGAGAVMDRAKKAISSTGKGAAKLPWRGIKATGIPGGIKQAWSKRVTLPLDRARQQRESFVAGHLGDKSAAERTMMTRASQYGKDGETEEDLKKWATNGDAAAALALANQKKMDPKTFAKSMSNIKDVKSREVILKKVSETRMDITLDYKLAMDDAKATNDPTKKGWANKDAVAKDEYGQLTAEEWSKQEKLNEQFASPVVEKAAKKAFGDLHDVAKTEALKRMNGANSKAITTQTP